MSLTPSKLIEEYYRRFHKVDVVFTQELIQTTGLLPEQVRLKHGTEFWPCVLYSASFEGAKVAASNRTGIINLLEKKPKTMSLRLSFKTADNPNPVTFFVVGNVTEIIPYKNSDDVFLLNFRFSKHPPVNLIEILGRVLDADVNAIKNKNEKVVLADENSRKLKLTSKESAVFVRQVPCRCYLRELSFASARIIMTGAAKLLAGKEASLRIDFDDPRESFLIKGKFTDAEILEEKKEMLIFNVEFDETAIPRNYKIRINEYLKTAQYKKRVHAAPQKEHAVHARTRTLKEKV